MDWLGKTCIVGCHWVPRVQHLLLQGVRAYLQYLAAVANVGRFSLRVSLPDLTCLPLGGCPVGASQVVHEWGFPLPGVLAYLGGRLVTWGKVGGSLGGPRGMQSSGHRVHVSGHFAHELSDQAYLSFDCV